MPPEDATEEIASSDGEKQYLFIIRHGDRWDYSHPEWLEKSTRKGDPPLSLLGHQQARETGIFLDSTMAQDGITANDVTWLSSPFLRCLQTSDDALNMFRKADMDSVKIHPEYSVFEIDGHGGKAHESLPSLEERKCYFPRLNETYKSVFVPDLPESKEEFRGRCDRAMKGLNQRFTYSPRTAIVIVSHAAGCIALVRAAANASLTDINAAGPCAVFRLTRTSNTDTWDVDHYSKVGGFNGHTAHLSDMGTTTVPWNHFGDKSVNNGYTGPPRHLEL